MSQAVSRNQPRRSQNAPPAPQSTQSPQPVAQNQAPQIQLTQEEKNKIITKINVELRNKTKFF